jgi:hypothetical protein
MVRDAGQVIVLAEGRVQETGTPEELVEKDGWFARFAAAADQDQTEGEEGDPEEDPQAEEDDPEVEPEDDPEAEPEDDPEADSEDDPGEEDE